jgi:aldose 1-epimerase
VQVRMTYTLTHANEWRIDYHAESDAATPFNITNHSYFNLRDAGATPHLDHHLMIDADRMTQSDAGLLPTGAILSVEGTAFDFRQGKTIGQDFASFGISPPGLDHNFVIDHADTGSLRRCARLWDLVSGRSMECWTTEPAVQVYSGNVLKGTARGKSGNRYPRWTGICFETQHYPDSVNHPSFPSTILRPGKAFESTTIYRFGAVR